MTTAHRATWKAARGGLQEEGSFRLHVPSAGVSAKDAPTERTLKLRADTTEAATRTQLREALESNERKGEPPTKRQRILPAGADGLGVRASRFGDARRVERSGDDGEEEEGGKEVEEGDVVAVGGGGGEVGDVDGEEESEEESDDDEAELLAELERIRKEREFEKAKKKAEEQERLEREETARVSSANPLLPNLFKDEFSDTASMATGSMPAFAVRRRWDDDVLFRGQAKGERKTAPRFINDTIRNDFHRRFMKKYMR